MNRLEPYFFSDLSLLRLWRYSCSLYDVFNFLLSTKKTYKGISMNSRHFTRVNYSVGASISFGSEILFCNTDNLSLRGFFLKTDHDIPLNISVQVTLYNPNQSSLRVNARVVRRGDNGVGLKINYLDVNSFVQLRKIITEFSNDPGAVTQETFKMLKCIH